MLYLGCAHEYECAYPLLVHSYLLGSVLSHVPASNSRITLQPGLHPMRYQPLILLVSFLLLPQLIQAQDTASSIAFTKPLQTPNLLSNDQRITDLYAAAVDGGFVTGKDGTFTFKASLFGLGKIFNPHWDLDTEYLKRTGLRNVEISTAFVFGKDDKIESFRPSIRWAVINKRDRSAYNFYTAFQSEYANVATELAQAMQKVLNDEGLNVPSPDTIQQQRIAALQATSQKFSQTGKLSDLDSAVQDALGSALEQGNLQAFKDKWSQEAAELDKKLLLTVTAGGDVGRSHNRDSLFAEAALAVGLEDAAKRVYDIVLKSQVALKDTSMAKTDFSRVQWLNSAGIESVLVRDRQDNALLESKLAMEYTHILSGHQENEKDGVFNFALTLSPLVAEDIALPLTLKWDPENGDVFAKFSLLWKFTRAGKK